MTLYSEFVLTTWPLRLCDHLTEKLRSKLCTQKNMQNYSKLSHTLCKHAFLHMKYISTDLDSLTSSGHLCDYLSTDFLSKHTLRFMTTEDCTAVSKLAERTFKE